jgi:hypothetical protein
MYYDVCVAELCDCIYNDDSTQIVTICSHCQKREDNEKKHPWYIEVKTIKLLLHNTESTDDINIRIINIKNIFEFLLTRPDFLAKNPNFRNKVLLKIVEFRNDELGKDLHELCNNLDLFVKSLAEKDNYIA